MGKFQNAWEWIKLFGKITGNIIDAIKRDDVESIDEILPPTLKSDLVLKQAELEARNRYHVDN